MHIFLWKKCDHNFKENLNKKNVEANFYSEPGIQESFYLKEKFALLNDKNHGITQNCLKNHVMLKEGKKDQVYN